ncbi:PD-(D/E)XK nuclease family transposase [Lacrimispora sp. 210928-DFI.3.58]|uniref:PD-(D/E)XK nuclease family transposase n=1 Tax=Lacrimispora sp. 210928-DFI.3.58 TaxID=2883214 RepID=UPI001D0791DF|nr:PD-(D/E)XK nuclease family transposase [Lacrimispora sp. 210928-DFI.3.58]MCB7320208.1 PD-(D/E)XK nuclease family transposase [Lacrimispora sp. 210928-DFI.3.58]
MTKLNYEAAHTVTGCSEETVVPASNLLGKYFPMIRTREDIRERIGENVELKSLFEQWSETDQEMFLDYCSGIRGIKVLYDGIFKEIFNPEATPERLEELLSLLLDRDVHIKAVLPNDSVRLGAESALLYTDIIVELEDESLADIEIRKIGYAFPGERCACYSADHLLRQYKRVRGKKGKRFHYRDIKNVYTIVFFEKSPQEFHKQPEQWLHIFRQSSDSGLILNLLQEYVFVPLDIFVKSMDNKSIDSRLEAWLTFLSTEEPERIIELITRYPQFKTMYQDIYEICLNIEKVMNMYSKELAQLDHNTVLYMIDEMQEQLDRQRKELCENEVKLNEIEGKLGQTEGKLSQTEGKLSQAKGELSQAKGELSQAKGELSQTKGELSQAKGELSRAKGELSEAHAKLAYSEDQRMQQDQLIKELQAQLEKLKR